MARSSIVTTSSNTRRPFGKPAGSPPIKPRLLGFDVAGMAMFRRRKSAWVGPVKFWNPGTIPGGMPVSKIAARSALGCPDVT